MIIEGQKWACQSCIRGHRVSNCTHADRELFPIAPKGRPVKQCEHCRTARKDKSHHAKCNCGNKKHKDVSSESGPKIEGFGCSCHKPGNKCVCGIKSEAADLRIQEQLLRRPLPVKSRPTLDTRVSESVLTTGHPKPQHRNTLGHTSCQPYQKPKRPASLHGPSHKDAVSSDLMDGEPRAADDMLLLNGNASKMYGMDVPTMSADNLPAYFPTGFESGLDFGNYFSGSDVSTPDASSQLFRTTSADAISSQSGWYDTTLSTVAEAPGDFVTSPTGVYGESDWNIPSATSDFFSPSDLPLSTSMNKLSQTISHSGESNYQSVPGLTASSSGAQSEIDGPTGNGKLDAFPALWSGTVQFRESTPVTSAPQNGVFAFPASVPNFEPGFKPTSSPRRHRQTYSGGSHHTHNGSGSTTVPGDYGFTSNVNIGHLQNLATLKSAREAAAARSASQSPSGFQLGGESDVGAIAIPNSEDYYDEFDFPFQPPQPTENSRQFSWLLDSQ
ncbi:uncharacterized protein PV09_04503 [Verruconis gallopava]|uniref:Copper-fist domain-containing protein n=1 Tax=Verruconis gallopava TaxID=253628 RepID=A0A0D2ACG5_9PEZI|nr:uncharacterized protein PV09_04503 [Verruconis gallopava]KIW04195.1 hypothetical protein PV09_04503 [Verruconis gallopava]